MDRSTCDPEPPVCGVAEEADLGLVDHTVRNQTARRVLHDVLRRAPLHLQIRRDRRAELHDVVIRNGTRTSSEWAIDMWSK